MKPKVLITKKFPEAVLTPLREVAEVIDYDGGDYSLMPLVNIFENLPELAAIINQGELQVLPSMLDLGSHLKVIANVAIGFENLNPTLLSSRGIWGTNTPGHFSKPVAEYVIAGVLSLLHKIPQSSAFLVKGLWNNFEPGRWDGASAETKIFGILGMGAIGSLVADKARAMGFTVIYYGRSHPNQNYRHVPIEELIRSSDVFSIHIPFSKENHHFINGEILQQLKPGVIFVNTSRGKVVDEKELIAQITSGRIGGALLDVFEHEPEVPEELINLDNVILTPHIAGGTHEARINCYKIAIDNVMEVLKGNKPPNAINSLV